MIPYNIEDMSMVNIIISIQYFSIVVLFLECWLVIRNWKSDLHSYLFLGCISTLVNSIGYLFELQAKSEASFVTALQLSYFGRVWITFSFFMFAARLCKIRIPNFVADILIFFHAGVYFCVMTFRNHSLFYYDCSWSRGDIFPVFMHKNGIVHNLFVAVSLAYIALGLTWLIMVCRKEKRPKASRRLLAVLAAVSAESVFFVLQAFRYISITNIYDISMVGNMIGNAILFVAIFKHDLLGTTDIAREMMIDRISEGIIAVDNDGIVQYFNDDAGRIFPELATGSSHIPEVVTGAMGSGEVIRLNDRIYSTEMNELVHNGEILGKLYALIDDTEHFRYMEILEREKEMADSASEAKSRFLANMSHEIRTPINAVLGMDEMILRESTEKPIRKYAADIMSAGKTLLSLINDILDISKVEEGKMEIIPVQYDPASLVNDLVNMTADRAAKLGLKFNVKVDEHIPRILFGDEIRIRQCALNLLSNAVKYTEKGCVSLEISCEKKDDSNILLSIKVEDTGIGMQKEDMEKLFSPYERLDERRNRKVEGTGLGMAITRQLLDLMGAGLNVDSEYGKGSSFSFTVEQGVVSWEEIGDYTKRYNEANDSVGTYREMFHAPDARILVVDDTEINLTVIESLLKQTRIRIDTALSGKSALDLAAVNDYDVMFIDHMMSGMDGIETLKHIRELDKNHDTPAVALTANAVSGARQMYINEGFDDYLSKPVEGARLERMLLRFIPDEKIDRDVVKIDEVKTVPASERAKILVVDDDESVCALICSLMESEYDMKVCNLGKEAHSAAKEFTPDLIMLDIHLQDANGFAVMQELKEDELTSQIPVLLLTGDNDTVTEENGFKSGAADYIRKPFVPDVLKQRVKRIIALHRYQQTIEKEVDLQTRKSKRLSREMMLALSKTVDTKDHYTDGHSRRVAAICAELARRLGKSGREQVEMYEIGLLHDIGKIGVHEDIIQKNSKLSDDEFLEIKEHTVKGYEILKEIDEMPNLREGARWHHERYDGKGYPDGLAGDEIPESARITCVADVYDAMTSTRTYSVPKSQADVRAEYVRCRGTIFDPVIADVMIAMIDEDKDYVMNEKARSADVWKEYSRLWENIDTTDPGDNPVSSDPLPAWLYKVTGMDVETGVANCGSPEGFLSVLSVFHQTAPAKADEIEKLYEENNIEDYTIRVHALKSSARIIGVSELSHLAEELENAGKNRDSAFISDNTKKLLEMYRTFDAGLSQLDETAGELEKADEKMMKDAYQTIVEIAQSMDYGLMEDMIRNLKGYALGEDDKSNIAKIEEMLSQLDWDGITEAAQNALSGM